MTKASRPRPTAAEFEILRVLWQRGPSTVREVHEALAGRDVGYTTVLKLLQIMVEKGLAQRDESQRAHVYEAGLPREQTEGQLVRELADRAFGGSAARLVMRALSSRKASADELNRIREFLDELEAERR